MQVFLQMSFIFNVKLEREGSAKSCLQICLKTFIRIEYKQGVMPDPPNALISTVCKRMLLAPAALLLCLQECFLAGSEKLVSNGNINATGEGTTGKMWYVFPQTRDAPSAGRNACVLQPSASSARKAAILQQTKSMKAF